MRKEVLWWSAVVVVSAVLGLIFALVVLAVQSDGEPAVPVAGQASAGSEAISVGSASAKREMTTVTVTTQPPGAMLFTSDGKPLGKEPITLPAEVGSTVVVLAKLDGFPPVTNFAEEVEAGETITIRLDLFRDGSQGAQMTKPERKHRDREGDRDRDRDDKAHPQGSGSRAGFGSGSSSGSGSGSGSRKKKGSGYDGNDVVE